MALIALGDISVSSCTHTVKGAEPNTLFAGLESETNYVQSSGTYQIVTFTTEAHGNGSAAASLGQGSGGDDFQVETESGAGAGYTGGFTVPQ